MITVVRESVCAVTHHGVIMFLFLKAKSASPGSSTAEAGTGSTKRGQTYLKGSDLQ